MKLYFFGDAQSRCTEYTLNLNFNLQENYDILFGHSTCVVFKSTKRSYSCKGIAWTLRTTGIKVKTKAILT